MPGPEILHQEDDYSVNVEMDTSNAQQLSSQIDRISRSDTQNHQDRRILGVDGFHVHQCATTIVGYNTLGRCSVIYVLILAVHMHIMYVGGHVKGLL